MKLYECDEIEINITDNIPVEKILETYSFPWNYNGRTSYIPLDEYHVVRIAPSKNKISARLYTLNPNYCLGDLSEKVIDILRLKQSFEEFYSLAIKDPLLRDFAIKYRGWRPRKTSLWWGLVISICQQNTSFLQGWKMLANIQRLYGKYVKIENEYTILPPSPKDILENPDKLALARVGYRKETIVNVAKYFAKNKHFIKKLPPEDLCKELLKIKGIGKYSARLALVLSTDYYKLPPIDRWLQKIIVEVYNVDTKRAEEFYKDYWGKWAGIAALATTIALDAVPISKALQRIKKGILVPAIENKPTPANMWKFKDYW